MQRHLTRRRGAGLLAGALALTLGAGALALGTSPASAAPGDTHTVNSATATLVTRDVVVPVGTSDFPLGSVTQRGSSCTSDVSADYGDGGGVRFVHVDYNVVGCGAKSLSSGQFAYQTPGRYSASVITTQTQCIAAFVCIPLFGPAGSTTAPLTVYVTGPNAIVSANANPVTATESGLFSGQVAAFQTGACVSCTYTATVRWGDGTQSTASAGASPQGNGTVVGQHVYATEGVYDTQIDIVTRSTDGVALDTDTVRGKAKVDDAPLIASTGGSYAQVGPVHLGEIGRFTDANAGAIASDYQILVSWGDGTTGLAAATKSGTEFVVSASHTYPGVGTYPVTFRVRSTRGQEAAGTSTIQVLNTGGG